MKTVRALAALPLLLLLAACDDSSSSSGGDGNKVASTALVGSWAYDSANERTVQTFTATRFHEEQYVNTCLVQETWGGYVFDGSLWSATIDSGRMRSFFTMEDDSASTCAQPMFDGVSSTFLVYPLENVTDTSFTTVTAWISNVDGKQTSGTVRHVFAKMRE